MSNESDLQQPKAFIGIDQSYSGFGLVVLSETGELLAQELWKFPSKHSDAERLLFISHRLTTYFYNVKRDYPGLEMAMEGYAYGAKLNREKMGELGGVVKAAWFEATCKDPRVITPTELKKHITGKGRASKEEILAAVQITQPDIVNHNVADAYGLAHMLWSRCV